MAITRKRRVFIEEYFQCGFNATEAARRAGYKHPNVKGSQLVKVSEIALEIQKLVDEYIMGRDEVLFRLAEQARGLPKKYFHPDGSLNAAAIVTADKTHLIKKTKQTRDGLEVELYDAQHALVDIGRAHGLFKDKVDMNISGEVVVTLDWGDDGSTNGETADTTS